MFIILLALALFGVIHSLLAGQAVKRRVRERVGARAYEGFYRLAYNALATIMLIPVGLLLLVPGGIVWQVTNPLLALAMNGVRLAGLVGLAISLLQIDLGRFLGLSQLVAYFRGDPLPLPPEPLQTGGLYGVVRHPLYLFSMLVIWPAPTMTDVLFGLNLGATAYFALGSLAEERRMLNQYGEAYATYRRQVPWMLPTPGRRHTSNSQETLG